MDKPARCNMIQAYTWMCLLFLLVFLSACSSSENPFQEINPVITLTPETFANPPAIDRPWVRWNFPPETAETGELQSQLEALHEAGIAGVEIGQGGDPTLAQLEAILKKANELGMKVSLKYKTGIPLPGTFPENHDYVRKTIKASDQVLPAGTAFNDTLPGSGTILAVQAYRCRPIVLAGSEALELDPSSFIDLTENVTGKNTAGYFGGSTTGRLEWTAPEGTEEGDWVLIAFRMTLIDPQPEVFSLEGTRLLIEGYESYWTEEIKNLLKLNDGGDIFVDSHSTDGFGAPNDLWSSNMAEEFQKRMGYDLIKHLPALIGPGSISTWGGRGSGAVSGHLYSFSDGSESRVLADYNQVRSDLFVEERIIPFTEWAHGYNMTLRLQPEDIPTGNIPDQIDVTYHLERPEHETLIGGDQIDVYRPMASAIHMNGNSWFSTELAASLQMNYVQTFQDIVVRMNKGFAAGQTKGVYHVYPYGDAPDALWPGYNSFDAAGFSNSWGPRNPIWFNEAKTINQWMARNALVLKQGSARIDLAVYMHNYSFPGPFGGGKGNERYWKDLSLQEAGYTWDYLNPTLINLPGTKVTNHLLAAEGPSYKALILDGFLQSASIYNPARNTLTIDAAKKILDFAQHGLPVVIVGELPSRTPGITPEDDEVLKGILDQLLEQGSVYRAATESEVPGVLKSAGIEPAVMPEESSSLMSMRRYDTSSRTNYYFLYNQGDDQIPPQAYDNTGTKYEGLSGVPRNVFEETRAIRTSGLNPGTLIGTSIDLNITLQGNGIPFLLNAWSGEITPIVDYKENSGGITLNVKLESDASMLIGITEDPEQYGMNVPETHVNNTDADGAKQLSDGSIAIMAKRSGTYTTLLSDGQTLHTTIDNVPDGMDLTHAAWNLMVEDWKPAQEYGTTGKSGAETTKELIALNLDSLKAWPDIPQLVNTSGAGTYITSINLPEDWNVETHGAILDLGQVVDAFRLTVNNQVVAVDQVGAIADISQFLKAGSNEISIRVSTTLNNRLAVLHEGVARRDVIQEYGLVGPVLLIPYKQAIVWSK